jgi:Transposase DDE domain group 1
MVARSWNTGRRACARIEATTKGLDIRFIVTSIETGSTEHIYEMLYCARGQAENLIKLGIAAEQYPLACGLDPKRPSEHSRP